MAEAHIRDRREYRREYYVENRAHILARQTERRAANPAMRVVRNRQSLARRMLLPWRNLLYSARQRAKNKGLEYTLSTEWARAKYTGFCELSGIAFRYGKGRMWPFSPSIDRIDQSKGYTPDNCRFLLMAINNMRGTLGDAEMFMIAKRLVASAKCPI